MNKLKALFSSTKTIRERVEALVAVNGDEIAVIQGDRLLTWRQLDEQTNKLANGLLELGAKKGDLVAIMLPNGIEYLETIDACCKIGVIPCSGINSRYTPNEIKHVINNSLAGDSKFLVIDELFVEKLEGIRAEINIEHYIVVGDKVPEGMINYKQIKEKQPVTAPVFDWTIKPDDDGIIILTGGTTGYPKGVLWSNEGYLRSLAQLGSMNLLGDLPKFLPVVSGAIRSLPDVSFGQNMLANVFDSRTLNVLVGGLRVGTQILKLSAAMSGKGVNAKALRKLKMMPCSPMFHGAATYGVCTFHYTGGCICFMSNKVGFKASEFCQMVKDHEIMTTIVTGDGLVSPLLEYLETEEGKDADLSSLVLLASSGVNFSGSSKKKIFKHMPRLMIGDVCGSTESMGFGSELTNSTVMDTITPQANFGKVATKGLKCTRVVNPETGENVKPGERGELINGGWLSIAKGYYKDTERTEKYFRVINGEKWFFITDGASIDADGSFHVHGRVSGIINTGGEKVYPEEVETVMMAHPKISAICITSVPDERWGEAVTAIIKLRMGEKATAEEITEWSSDKLAHYKKPKNIIFMAEMPVNAVGKVEKPKLKKIAHIWKETGRLPMPHELDEAMKEGKRI